MISDYFGEARERRRDLEKRPDYVRDVLREGGEQARAQAEQYMEKVRACVGLLTTY
jgi:tryptophanyl-tRNA synthetase